MCTVIARGACEGTGRVVLELGRKRVAHATMPLAQRDARTQELRVPARVWQRALRRSKTLVYETLLVRLRLDGKCADGSRGAPPQSWSDSFVGAFAGGE